VIVTHLLIRYFLLINVDVSDIQYFDFFALMFLTNFMG